MAARTDNSPCRADPRASSRLATFAHATSKHKANGAQQHEQRPLHVADDHVAERGARERQAVVRSAGSLLQLRAHALQVGIDRDAVTPGFVRAGHAAGIRCGAPCCVVAS